MTDDIHETINHDVPYFTSLLAALNAVSKSDITSMTQVSFQSVSGGSIHSASLVTLPDHTQVFLKQNRSSALPLFKSELIGLAAISQAGARCSQPLAIGLDAALECSFLLLAAIDSRVPVASQASLPYTKGDYHSGWADLAEQLALLHRGWPPQPPKAAALLASNQQDSDTWQVGWLENNFIGRSLQINSWHTNWHEFFAEQRLGYQLKLAVDNGRVGSTTSHQIERLLSKLPEYLPTLDRPSLVHGDLWSGNVLIDREHRGYLIDPAVYVGHPEVDLAMTALFGGFDTIFYEAYYAQLPKLEGFDNRQDIYNLYHYLNHLNLFGSSYLDAVKRIAQRFGGYF